MQLYRPMLKEALVLTWKFKYLWFFGLFAALAGNGGAFNLGMKNLEKVESGGVWLTNFKTAVADLSVKFSGFNLRDALETIDALGVVLFVLLIAVMIFFLWLTISCQAGLAYGSRQAMEGRRGIFEEVMKKGISKFWPALLLNILLSAVIMLALALVSLPFMILYMSSSNVLWQVILILLSFIVLVPVAIVLSLIVRYALLYVVNEDLHIGEALKKAWHLFVKNWIVSLEMGFLLFLVNLLTGILLMILMVFVALPFVMLGMLFVNLGSGGFVWLIVAVGVLTFIALMFLYAAMWNTFEMASWVILFEKIKGGVVYSKILRWAVWLSGGKKME